MFPQSEALERAALEDLHRAAPPELRHHLGIDSRRVGPAFISLAAALPRSAIVINRCLGLGLSWPAEASELLSILSAYRQAAVKRYFIQLHPDARPPGIRGWLESHDLVEARGWQKFSRGPGAVAERPTELEVREVGPEQGAAFGTVVCNAFDIGAAAIPWLAELPGRAGWHVFMSFHNDVAAGAGALFVHRGLAWLDYAATHPAYRRRGSQGAIQAARIRRALDLGCKRIYTCTGVDKPGDPQHSYGNILKSGFEREEIRLNFSPAE